MATPKSKAQRKVRLAPSGGYLPPFESEPHMAAAWAQLVREVNARRYRGVRREEPMTDRYYWPLEIRYMDDISQAALQLIVAAERKADNDSRSAISTGSENSRKDAQ